MGACFIIVRKREVGEIEGVERGEEEKENGRERKRERDRMRGGRGRQREREEDGKKQRECMSKTKVTVFCNLSL